jgi:hypothetical protein
MARKNSKLKISFQKVDPQSRKERQGVMRHSSNAQPYVAERTVESMWHDKTPKGWNFLDWHRAWNEGYPSEEHVELYNSMHPVVEQIALVEESGG